MAIESSIQQQVYDLLSRSSNVAIVPAEPVVESPTVGTGQQPLTLALGQRVLAEVTGQPQGGKIPVQIAGQQLQLDLQMPVRQGQSLELTFVGSDPRMTFALVRPGITAPPVTLSDASRLLSLLVSNEQFSQPNQRASLQSVADLVRQSSGSNTALSGFLDDILSYPTTGRGVVVGPAALPGQTDQQVGGDQQRQPPGQSATFTTGQQPQSASFGELASRLLMNMAQRERLTLIEASNQPMAPLPLKAGEEANGLVQGSLPGGRTVVQLAGEALELQLPRPVQQGEILRLILISQQPKLVFAMLGQPHHVKGEVVSDAARWLSALASREEGAGGEQRQIVGRLQQMLSSLPPGSPLLAAIMDEAMTYNAAATLPLRQQVGGGQQQQGGKIDEAVLKLLQSLLQGNRLALVEPQPEIEPFKGMKPGQQLRGEVLQNLGGERFLLQVGGEGVEVQLPKGARVGERLNLFFVGNDPPTLLLVRQGKGGDALVSQTGRWLSTMISPQESQLSAKEGFGVLRTLLQTAPSDPAQLEQGLKQGVKGSGLFYEAHLSRWFSGKYPLEELLKEPQGRLSTQPGQVAAERTLQQQGASLPIDLKGGQMAQHGKSMSQGAPPQQGLSPQQGETVQQSQQRGEPLKLLQQQTPTQEGVDPRTMPLVKEQLATLQSGQVLFQGELFPGQQVELRIKDNEKGGGDDEQEQQSPWETRLVITLPKLGRVEVDLDLVSNKVDLAISAEQEETVTGMEIQLEQLKEQLLASGLEPGKLTVKRHG